MHRALGGRRRFIYFQAAFYRKSSSSSRTKVFRFFFHFCRIIVVVVQFSVQSASLYFEPGTSLTASPPPPSLSFHQSRFQTCCQMRKNTMFIAAKISIVDVKNNNFSTGYNLLAMATTCPLIPQMLILVCHRVLSWVLSCS